MPEKDSCDCIPWRWLQAEAFYGKKIPLVFPHTSFTLSICGSTPNTRPVQACNSFGNSRETGCQVPLGIA